MTAPTFIEQRVTSGSGYSIPGGTQIVYGDWGPWHDQLFEQLSWPPGIHYGGGANDATEYIIGVLAVFSGGLAYWAGSARERSVQYITVGGGYVPLSSMPIPGVTTPTTDDLITMVVEYDLGSSVVTVPGFTLVARWTPNASTPSGLAVYQRRIVADEPTSYSASFNPPVNSANVSWYCVRSAGAGVVASIAEVGPANPMLTPAIVTQIPDNQILAVWAGQAVANGVTAVPVGMSHATQQGRLYTALEATVGTPSVVRSLSLISPSRVLAASILIPPFNVPPVKPTFLDPGPGGAVDMHRDWSMVFQANDPNGPTDPPSAIRLRRTGALELAHWFDGTDWDSAVSVDVTTGPKVHFQGIFVKVDVDANEWTQDEHLVQMATRDQAGLWGPYMDAATITGIDTPGVTLIAPLTVVDDRTRPVLLWDAPQQNRYTTKIWTQAAYLDAAFDPEVTLAIAGSLVDVLGPTVKSWTSTVDLENLSTYVAGVKIKESHGLGSDWDFKTFTINVDAPAAPVMTTAWENALARVALSLSLTENLLTANEATMDDVAAWDVGTNAELAVVVDVDAVHGTNVLEWTVPDADQSEISIPRLIPIRGNEIYSIGLTQWTPDVPRTVSIVLDMFNADGNYVQTIDVSFDEGEAAGGGAGLLSLFPGLVGTGVGSNPIAHTGYTFLTNPAAVFLQVKLRAAANEAGQVHKLDGVSLRRGADSTFRLGGLSDSTQLAVFRSYDGITFEAVRNGQVIPSAYGDAVVYDYEGRPGATVTYRATGVATIGDATISSPPADAVAVIAQTVPWLKVPTDPTLNRQVVRYALAPRTRPHRIIEHQPPFRDDPITVSTGWSTNRGTLSVYTDDPTEEDLLEALITSDLTLLFQEPADYGTVLGRQRYVVILAQLQVSPLTAKRYPDRSLSASWVEVSAPDL